MKTQGKYEFQYGYIECRAKIPARSAMWPAWWTLGTGGGNWPANGEIDILEYFKDALHINLYIQGTSSGVRDGFQNNPSINSLGGDPWRTQFHTYGMLWTVDRITIYVDNTLMMDKNQSYLMNKDGSGFYPFKQKIFMLLNLAVGGRTAEAATTGTYPADYVVDYVRHYYKP